MGLFSGKSEKELTLKIGGMHCDMCATNLKRELELVKGVKNADVSFSNGQAIVIFDEKKTDIQEISGAVAIAGYQVI